MDRDGTGQDRAGQLTMSSGQLPHVGGGSSRDLVLSIS